MKDNFDKPQNQKVPGYIRILLSKYFYLDFIERLRQNIWYEIVIFLFFFLIALIYKDYKYPIFAIGVYTFVSLLINAYKFRIKLRILMLEESLKLLEDKKGK